MPFHQWVIKKLYFKINQIESDKSLLPEYYYSLTQTHLRILFTTIDLIKLWCKEEGVNLHDVFDQSFWEDRPDIVIDEDAPADVLSECHFI